MLDLTLRIAADKVPEPFDRSLATQKLADWHARIAQDHPEHDALFRKPEVEALLLGLFGNSPYLSASAFKTPEALIAVLTQGPDAAVETLFESLTETLPKLDTQDALMRALRQAKLRLALTVAVADITGHWPLEKVTGALSEFAELAVDHAVAHIVRARMVAGDLAWTGETGAPATPALARSAGYIVLGMGKLGGRELNYSSDIDLIVMFDGEVVQYVGRRDPHDCFIRMTRDLVKVLQERTADGYVFRVDLALRPDPGATPVAISVDAAEIYYQSVGLNWERAAMIKARPVGGDLNAGRGFLDRIKAFVWRKHLDYVALEDIHAMKARIHSHHKHGGVKVAGQDVKLGPGGIREIEFFVQAHQLISGGRTPELRIKQTMTGIEVLRQLGTISEDDATDLLAAYRFLRTLEHRIQMTRDEQTHKIPDRPEGVAAIAAFMAYPSAEAFETDVLHHLNAVRRRYDDLFSETHTVNADERWNRLFAGGEAPDDIVDDIAALGFENPGAIVDMVRSWQTGRFRALRTDRARALLKILLPVILRAFAKTAEPTRALQRFNDFLSRLPSGVQLLTLFQANPNLLELVAEILGTAPALSDFLAHNHLLLDSVLSPGFMTGLPDQQELEDDLTRALASAADFQDVMDLSRRWANERKFQIGVQLLRGIITASHAATAHTALAEAVIRCMLPAVEDDFARRHGRIPGGGIALIAMGSFGGFETSFTSDLDLIFIYQVPEADLSSDGDRPLPASQYFARLGQRIINALTALTGEGRLYEVDMQLRPSGRAGPLAVSVEAFETYQRGQAWLWEHMALTRARPVAGTPGLMGRVGEVIRSVLATPREPDKVLFTVADMRRRLAAEFGTENPWGVKHVRGGLLDLEFIAQYLQLLYGANDPSIFSPHTVTAFRNIRRAGLIQPELADELERACILMDAIRGFSRQILGGDFDPAQHASPALLKALTRSTGFESFDALSEAVTANETRVKAIFDDMIAHPASLLKNPEDQDHGERP
ncbi:bifunctional [glutamine synthetase] adenylyltransferase/[glutamine synthetase]-adenylyl-L-tyrosine phosphorylase [Iodidimonas sp. SYSU 1G8]|uniref:bifunctional [glutamine synthetase] adenylyltransferase/[glutamine synthetase]-adenylyl-L-tyrosine phosphorylase n=1 Tax=Iodidimonas sp. SYSU 1G8 TaxID=3133967 RepID=UPI0031FE6FC9